MFSSGTNCGTFSKCQKRWSDRNINLEIKSDSSIAGFKTLSDGTARKADLDGANVHDNIVHNLKSEFSKTPEVTPLKIHEMGDVIAGTPDVLLRFENQNKKIALEVKVRWQDLKKSMFQCRTYKLRGASPYLTIPKQLFVDYEDDLKTIYNNMRTNTPGILLVDGSKTINAITPKY